MRAPLRRERRRFSGQIAGLGSTSGTRVVIGRWLETDMGSFCDAMVQTEEGHRVLIAPNQDVHDLVAGVYHFDETRHEDISIAVAGPTWHLTSPSLTVSLEVGGRMPLGWLLRAVPGPIATNPAITTLTDPIARVVLPGTRTRGQAGAGSTEYYTATDMHSIVSAFGEFDGVPLGDLAPVDPPCGFGFSSTPKTPSVTDVTTTIERLVAPTTRRECS